MYRPLSCIYMYKLGVKITENYKIIEIHEVKGKRLKLAFFLTILPEYTCLNTFMFI